MYCKHDTQADIESKRRIISEKIEMKRNSANLKRSSSILPKTADSANKILNEADAQKQKYDLDSVNEVDGQKPARPKDFKELKNKPNAESK